jgi:hypothetical protein
VTLTARDHVYLEDVSKDQLAALLLELASQLHVERQRRMALETELHRRGILEPAALDALADDRAFSEAARAALNISLRRLLRIMTEAGDPRGPLRAEAA